MQKITPFLWFDTQAEEAASFYVSLFPDAKITSVARYDAASAKVSGRPEGSAMTVGFSLAGQNFIALNGGPIYKFSEAVSFMVNCETQEEVDKLWSALLANGGKESQCGWLTDRFGLTWQIVPKLLNTLLTDKDPVKAQRVMQAMLGMKKIECAELQKAYDEA